jgi:hypothetical protein
LIFPDPSKTVTMPARKQGLPFRPVTLPPDIGNKANCIDQISRECQKIQSDNMILTQQIQSYERDSIVSIRQYRAEIDERSTKTHEVLHQIEALFEEMRGNAAQIRAENEKAKEIVAQEDATIRQEIETCQAQLEVIRKFEEDKESISKDIMLKEQSIEDEKRRHDQDKERAKKTTHDLFERNAKQNEETLEREKEGYYDHLLRTTDQAILLHIQRRNNYESDLLSLRDMYQDYTEKIQARKEGNAKLRETIEQLKSKELIDKSAEQRKEISDLRREVSVSREQLKALQAKVNAEKEARDKEREDETKRMELSLKLQQDQLDHKLQQISALRELTLKVLKFRSQLEAEFITVLGEMIYEVSQRNDPAHRTGPSRATRKLSMSSSSEGSQMVEPVKGSAISITHALAQFTVEDRIAVLERFMERVHGEVDENERQMSPLLNEEAEGAQKPTSV